MLVQEVKERIVNFDFKNTQYFFGFLGCWKMVGVFFSLLTPIVRIQMKWYDFAFLYLVKVPFWCLIKPFAKVWSIKTSYVTTTQVILRDGVLSSFKFKNFKKVVVHRFLYIPVFGYWTHSPNRADVEKFKNETLK